MIACNVRLIQTFFFADNHPIAWDGRLFAKIEYENTVAIRNVMLKLVVI